jgi:hypothetical protein
VILRFPVALLPHWALHDGGGSSSFFFPVINHSGVCYVRHNHWYP